ncbi:hypothetical protein ANN_24984 [Periplaneta americana]|uniref:Mos1 transposase HTH domain-containing protein n=1 Tax=Periplaneta americana TaxID=6978 RepID=A0ABQ8S038_PERAM|nr:hypothetical protein ANN_24984 [Periplaneta americana]
MSPGSSTESYLAFPRIGLRENPGKTSPRSEASNSGQNARNKIAQTDFGMDSARKRKEGKAKENLDERYKKWNEGERLGRTGLGGKRRMEEEDKNLNTLDTGRCIIFSLCDSKAAPLCMVEGGTVMRMLEFFTAFGCASHWLVVANQTIRKIQQVFGEDAMGVTQIKEWFNRFKDGRTSAESEQHCGRPQTARSAAVVERVRNLVMADRRLTVREIAEEVGDLLDTANTDPGFLNTVITGDESWVYGYDPGTKRQSSQWKHPESPRPKKARQVRSKIKVMLTVFFDVRGIVHHEYAPEGQMVTKEYYHDVLWRLRDAVRRKRPDMWTANNWHLHHDNAPAHSSQLIHTFLAKHGITTVHQPPYSPDLAPCDFWLFPKLKTPLKGSHFESREEIMRNATTELNTIPKEDFQRCFRQWKDRWAKCVQAQGAYFEGD